MYVPILRSVVFTVTERRAHRDKSPKHDSSLDSTSNHGNFAHVVRMNQHIHGAPEKSRYRPISTTERTYLEYSRLSAKPSCCNP